MKRFLELAAMSAVLAILAAGCSRRVASDEADSPWTYHGIGVSTKVVEIEGHRYVLMDGYKSGGVVHAESCPCRGAAKAR